MEFPIFALVVVLFVAYANGANDNFKGVATLFGSGTTSYRGALVWGTATTFAGSLTSIALARGLARMFSGKGLVPDALVNSPDFVTVVAFAAGATVLLATRLSLPISTTHALTGALVGAGLGLAGSDLRLAVLGGKFVLPLILSPLAAAGLAGLLYPILRWTRRSLGVERTSCICIGRTWVPMTSFSSGEATAAPRLGLATCQERYQGTILSVDAHRALNAGHYLTAGAVSFARGVNDTPKIVALLLAAQAFHLRWASLLAGLIMALGAVLEARRVAETMGHKITAMNHGQGFTANLVTAGLVIVASRFGLPVSTTHVSCGSLFGIGAVSGQARWGVFAQITFAWVLTLPVAAGLAMAATLFV